MIFGREFVIAIVNDSYHALGYITFITTRIVSLHLAVASTVTPYPPGTSEKTPALSPQQIKGTSIVRVCVCVYMHNTVD